MIILVTLSLTFLIIQIVFCWFTAKQTSAMEKYEEDLEDK